jgi:hypothetical protein
MGVVVVRDQTTTTTTQVVAEWPDETNEGG